MNSQAENITAYMFEPTNVCNLDCPLCPTGNNSNPRSKGFMDTELFEQVLDVEGIYGKTVMLWGWGEPLLHPGLSRIVTAAKKRKNRVEVQSNGTASYESYKMLLNVGVDTLTISLDGLTDETLQPLRGMQVSSEIIKRRIAEIVALRTETNASTHINIQCIATSYNEQEISAIRNWTLKVAKVDTFVVKTLCLGDFTQDKNTHYLPKDPSLRRYIVNEQVVSLPKISGRKCNFTEHIRVVLWDYTIVPCCYDYDGSYVLGNMLDRGLITDFKCGFAKKEMSMCDICPEMKVSNIFVAE